MLEDTNFDEVGATSHVELRVGAGFSVGKQGQVQLMKRVVQDLIVVRLWVLWFMMVK